jgi:hypothetical protein
VPRRSKFVYIRGPGWSRGDEIFAFTLVTLIGCLSFHTPPMSPPTAASSDLPGKRDNIFFAALPAVSMVLVILACCWPLYFNPKWDAYLVAKANGSPGLADPHLSFFMVPYNIEKREVLPFMVENLGHSLSLHFF